MYYFLRHVIYIKEKIDLWLMLYNHQCSFWYMHVEWQSIAVGSEDFCCSVQYHVILERGIVQEH